MWRILLLLFLTGCCANPMGQSFLGTKYINSPLGEGITPDTDPLFRTDAFDCVTFVETVLADSDVTKLNQIRYKNGNVSFLDRNHFIETDWTTNNANLVENVSAKYAKTAYRTVVIDKKSWFKQNYNIDTDFAPETVNLEYIPYENITELNINKAVIVMFVADKPKIRDKIGTDLAIFHMGLLLPGGVLRHASSQQKSVVDVDFYEYIAQKKQDKTNLGIILVRIK